MLRDERTFVLPISQQEVTIREADGYTERLLLRRNRKIYEVVPEYLASMIVRMGSKEEVTKKDVLALLTPDQEFLAIECFKLNYGDKFEFDYECPSVGCNQGVVERAFNLNDLEFTKLDPELAGTDPTVTVTLPRSGKVAVIGMLDGKKELMLLEQASNGTLDLVQSAYQAIRSLDGQECSYEDIVNLPLADQKAIRKARRKLVCGYDTNIVVTCDECGEKVTINVLMHKDFFLPAG